MIDDVCLMCGGHCDLSAGVAEALHADAWSDARGGTPRPRYNFPRLTWNQLIYYPPENTDEQ